MKAKPNISQLYQKKYIANTPHNLGYSLALPLGEQAITRYGHFSQRLYDLPKKTCIRCIRIRKRSDCCQVIKQRAKSFHFKEQNSHIGRQQNQAPQPRQRQSELIRQLMKLSHQQLSDFQLSLGGENKLLKTLKYFFQQRNKNKQEEKLKMTKSDFKPVRNFPERYEKKPIFSREKSKSPRERQRINKKLIINQISKHGQKDLAPWQIRDFQGQ